MLLNCTKLYNLLKNNKMTETLFVSLMKQKCKLFIPKYNMEIPPCIICNNIELHKKLMEIKKSNTRINKYFYKK